MTPPLLADAEMQDRRATLRDDLAALLSEARSPDAYTARARPTFLYVMYALLLWSVPVGIIAAVQPAMADAIVRGMGGYLGAIPEPLYALFGTGYLGYTFARQWGETKKR